MSTFAPCAFKLVIVCSSKSFEAIIFASVKPASSSIRLASLDKYAISPESNLIPIKLILSPNSFATLIAVGTPDLRVWKVSTKKTQFLCRSAYF